MDAMDKELDKLLLMIERMPNGEMRDKLIERYNGYRNKFEENGQATSAVSPLGLEILKFEVDVQAYVSGMSGVDPLKDYHILQPISTGREEKRQKNTKEIEEILIDILNSKISTDDIDALKGIIEDVQKEYKGLSSKNQELDLKIAESKYALMKGLLKSGRIEEATDLTKQFDTDMSIFLLRRLSPKVDELRSNGRLQDALFLAKYCKDGESKETDLKFWERIVNIEEPELDYKLPEKDNEHMKEEPKNEPKKEGMFTRIKKKREQARADKEYEQKKNVKVMHIRFDPTSDFHHMNKKDYEKVMQAIESSGKNIRIVFDEGITEIGLMPADSGNRVKRKYLTEVEFPTTATTIMPCAFMCCENLKHVDLTNTRVKYVGKEAFSYSNLELIYFPDCLEEIGTHAFHSCEKLKHVDLTNTRVKHIEKRAFSYSGLESIQFPNCLEGIGTQAFYCCENLKKADLSNTHLKEIGESAFSGWYSTSPTLDYDYISHPCGVQEVLLPDSLETIGWNAFEACCLRKVVTPKKFEKHFERSAWLYHHQIIPMLFPLIEFTDSQKGKKQSNKNEKEILEKKLGTLKSENLRNGSMRLVDATIEPEIPNDVQSEIS